MMMQSIRQWFQKSIARVIMVALLFTSVVPIILISILYVRQSSSALTMQMEANLLQLVDSKAEEIDLRLQEVAHTTQIAAHQAEVVLQQEIAADDIAVGIAKYAPDARQILGLDVYYEKNRDSLGLGEDLSNVYWPYTTANEVVQKQIIQTEALDTIFRGIKNISPDTQWIYMTTPEGMMRLYPWASNDHYPDGWDPRQIVFYTVAEPKNNPDLTVQWTAPYVDYAGAGWMVTASIPMFDESGVYLGVMSHDVTIGSLKEIALDINVLDDAGYGFLIAPDGGVIAHPSFQDTEASKGTQEEAGLLATSSAELRTLIHQMMKGEQGAGYFNEEAGDSLLVYAPVNSTDWALGITVPRENVIAPAIAMRNRVVLITLGLVGLSFVLSYVLTQLIHRPLVQLMNGVKQISDSDNKADEVMVNSFGEFSMLAAAFNEMALKVWERESSLKHKVAAMRIEIDQRKRHKQLDAIVETDFFKRLEMNASRLRADIKAVTYSPIREETY